MGTDRIGASLGRYRFVQRLGARGVGGARKIAFIGLLSFSSACALGFGCSSDYTIDAPSDASSGDGADARFDATANGTDGSSADASSSATDASSDDGAVGIDAANAAFPGLHVLFVGLPLNGNSDVTLHAFVESETGMLPTDAQDATIDATLLSGIDVVIVEGLSRTYAKAEVQALVDWVTAGGGAIVLAGFGGAEDSPTTLVGALGLSYGPSVGGPNSYGAAFIGHPLTTGVQSLLLNNGPLVTTNTSNASTWAMFDGGSAGVAFSQGSGRVAAWSDDWIAINSEMQRMITASPPFSTTPTQQFWHNALAWVSKRLP
jgi:hypothetical protein